MGIAKDNSNAIVPNCDCPYLQVIAELVTVDSNENRLTLSNPPSYYSFPVFRASMLPPLAPQCHRSKSMGEFFRPGLASGQAPDNKLALKYVLTADPEEIFKTVS